MPQNIEAQSFQCNHFISWYKKALTTQIEKIVMEMYQNKTPCHWQLHKSLRTLLLSVPVSLLLLESPSFKVSEAEIVTFCSVPIAGLSSCAASSKTKMIRIEV